MFKSLGTIAKAGRKSSRVGLTSKNGIVLSIHKGYKGNQTLAFLIGTDLLRKARFMEGDRIDVLYNPITNEGRIILAEDGDGYMVPRTTNKNKEETSKTVGMTIRDGMPSLEKYPDVCSDVSAVLNRIDFTFPEQCEVKAESAVSYPAGHQDPAYHGR